MNKNKKSLKAESIFEADDLPRIWIPTPEWGKNSGVYIRGMTGIERDTFEANVSGMDSDSGRIDFRNLRAKLVSMCAVDEEGNRIFNDSQVELLGQKSGAVLDILFDTARKASGIGDNDVKELAKN